MSGTLVLTAFTPALGTGRGARTYGVVAALARNGPVTVAYTPFEGDAPDAAFSALPDVELRAVAKGPRAARALAMATARARGVPAGFARGATSAFAREALAWPAGERVVADGPTVAGALLGAARRRPITYLAHNLESAFRHTLEDEGSPQAMRRFERRVLQVMDETWMVSRADVEGARALAPDARLRLVPNVVDVEAITPAPPAFGPTARRDVLFVGDLRYEPNARAARFLLDEVAPLLWAAQPDATVTVAGRGELAAPADPRARVLGFVDDLDALYAGAGAIVVPLLQGGGSPLKFVEALAHGVAVVATSKAAAGLDLVPGEHYLQADDAEGLAAALAHVLAEGDHGMGARGREHAEDELSVEALARVLRLR